ncbi:MAG: glycosyltransferase family 2 protein [Chitinophagaceae bacterium]
MSSVFISICIPAYKRIDFLERLLDSIEIQRFRDFEVVVTDDSPSGDVKNLCEEYKEKFPLLYFKNKEVKGTPENWNESIRQAKGQWIKLMHDDDWFADEMSLEKFAQTAKEQQASFIFSGYSNIFIEGNRSETYLMNRHHKALLKKDPVNLLKKNFIGHPSTTLIKNEMRQWYDSRLKWVVDLEFYIRSLRSGQSYYYIGEPLVNLGMSSEQVTVSAFRNPAIEIPENIELLKRISPRSLKRVWAYDYYWRFIRNLSVRNLEMINTYYPGSSIPLLLQKMIRQQRRIPSRFLRAGAISKITMLITYCWNRLRGHMK